MPDVVYHGSTHRPFWIGGSDPATPLGFYEIKVFADANALDGLLPPSATTVSVGDGKFIFAIPEDLDGARLVRAHAYVSTAGAVTVQIRNITKTVDMLSTRITIDTGDFTSYDAAVLPVINSLNSGVDTGDLIAIDVDAASGAQGLGVILAFAAV